jgi:hypothetical protein
MSHWKDVLRTVQFGGVVIAILGSGPAVHADPIDPLSVTGNVQAKAVTEGSGDKLVWTIQNTTNVILTLDNGLRTRGLAFNYTGGDRDDAPAISSTTGCDSGVMLAAQTGACVLVIAFTSPAVPDTGNDENNDRGFWDLTANELGAPVLTGSGPGIGTVQSGAIVGRVEVDDPGVTPAIPEPPSFVLVLTAALIGFAGAYGARAKRVGFVGRA